MIKSQLLPEFFGIKMVTRAAVTLIELMVVISILSAVALLVIPQVRTVSRERSLREASRTVAMFFNEASTRAKVDGFAGVVIARNPNYYRLVDAGGLVPDGTGNATTGTGSKVYYAGFTLYHMKRPRPFTGNTASDFATVTVLPPLPPNPIPLFYPYLFNVRINQPFDSRIRIEPGSVIQFGSSPVSFRINTVAPGAIPATLDLGCRCEGNQVLPQNGSAFRITPRPEIDTASAVNLPKGHYVNLNYSGNLDLTAPGFDLDNNDLTWTGLTQDFMPINRANPLVDPVYAVANGLDPVAFPAFVDPNTQPVVVIYGAGGKIDRVYPNGILVDAWVASCKFNGLDGYSATSPQQTVFRPLIPLMLCVSTDQQENTFSLNNSAAGYQMPLSFYRASKDVLNDHTVQWVTVDHTSGWTTTSDSVQLTGALVDPTPLPMAGLQGLRILAARGFATQRSQTAD